MENVERKFQLLAVCREHGHTYTEIDSILFLAKDKALPATLRFYRDECVKLEADANQVIGVDLLI